MKLARVPLKILLDEIAALDEIEKDLRYNAKQWSAYQEDRENGHGIDQDMVAYFRGKVERALVRYREQLAKVYDFQGDRGLM
jgi:hypothetical protein